MISSVLVLMKLGWIVYPTFVKAIYSSSSIDALSESSTNIFENTYLAS